MMLKVEDLSVRYFTKKGVVYAVDNVSLEVRRGEALALVGESGSGKSTLGFAIMRMVPPPGRIVEGRIILEDRDIMGLSEEEMRKLRGSKVSMVFQDPFTTLDPLRRVNDIVAEVMIEHGVDEKEAKERAAYLLKRVGIPEKLVDAYPHQLSGGQKQRVAIAAAISMNPSLLIADEPTTALDVIVQRQIMDLLDEIRRDMGMILITHDIALALERADRICVMYAGKVMEVADKDMMMKEAMHPYTKGLLSSLPRLLSREWPSSIPGMPPDLREPPKGCRFHPRCSKAMDICREQTPDLFSVDGRLVSCWLYGR
ncbi:ABC transporter ATP-binding protein [Candidatus Korarchaeum cryptofilum]|jgi:peptide/nickel transport system ATP-binding protein|uniref:Nickel import system ATP-binding protein NikD n=1 Tax=Korarchaeum cryptofilum (strain OPF8) TaxID=374847 RepID=B1L481_KORCO|nr:ABC transporter ATP-binding protein [Candidatus Korarchaeum cryptofilum]ACB07260.1 ABC-type dipeptide/oligopeptide/nickel transport system, ATPase component [Candidatus Korarchaeum cryptofilum OPF8]